MLARIDAHAAKRESFAFETTLSGRAYARRIPRWRAEGYVVTLVFLRLLDADMAVARVARRVREGGHDIPVDVIRRRFQAGLDNFQQVYLAFGRPLVPVRQCRPTHPLASAGWH